MKKRLTNNLVLKLLSLASAILLWFIVLYVEDPVDYADFSPIQVTMLNENVVTDQGLVYQVLDNSNVISIRVRARSSVLEKLSASDFTATADMEKNLKYGNLVGIEVTCSNRDIGSENITKSRENVVISVEDASTEQFNVVVSQQNEPPDGYAVGTMVPEQSIIQITGPASIVSKIKRVEAVIDVSTFTSDRTVHCNLRVVDGNNEQLSTADLATLEFTGKTEGMDVSVTMLRTKEVSLRLGYTGTPDGNYSFSSISYRPETVEIAGTAENIAGVSEIVIPDEAINIDGITENLQLTLDITPYLPEGIRLNDEAEASVAVLVEIERKQGRTIDIPVSEIGLQNVPRGYEVDFGDLEEVQIIVLGTSADLAELDTEQVAVSLDLSGYSRAGDYTETLQVTLPDDVYSLMNDVEVDFSLVRATTTADDEEENDGGTDQSDDSIPASGSGTGTGTGGDSSTGSGGTSGSSGPGSGTSGSGSETDGDTSSGSGSSEGSTGGGSSGGSSGGSGSGEGTGESTSGSNTGTGALAGTGSNS